MTAGVQEQHSVLKIILSQQQMCINWLHSVRSCLLSLKQFDLMPKVNAAAICSRFRTEAELDFPVWLTAVAKSWLLPSASFPLTLHALYMLFTYSSKVFLLGLAFSGFSMLSQATASKVLPLAASGCLTVHETLVGPRADCPPETMSSRSSEEGAYCLEEQQMCQRPKITNFKCTG